MSILGADGDRARVADAALEYLDAIADGRAEEASRLVPVMREGQDSLLIDDVLAAAQRVTDPTAGFAEIEGDRARIQVGFPARQGRGVAHAASGARRRRLARDESARRAGHELRRGLRSGSAVTLGGIPIPPGDVLLYPGLYAVDDADDSLFTTRATTFSVDGDPRSTAELAAQAASTSSSSSATAPGRCRSGWPRPTGR